VSWVDAGGVCAGGDDGRVSCVVLGGVCGGGGVAGGGAGAGVGAGYIEDQPGVYDGEWVDWAGVWGVGDCGYGGEVRAGASAAGAASESTVGAERASRISRRSASDRAMRSERGKVRARMTLEKR